LLSIILTTAIVFPGIFAETFTAVRVGGPVIGLHLTAGLEWKEGAMIVLWYSLPAHAFRKSVAILANVAA
jgi:hypothetical protein